MAAENKLTLMNPNGTNLLTDAQLKDDTDWDTIGIINGEIAASAKLNAILRQITTVTHSLADLVANELDKTIGSYDAVGVEQVTAALIKNTILDIISEVAENKNTSRAINTVWAAPSNAAGAPTFRTLAIADIPNNLTTAKIADSAITVDKINNGAVNSDKLASNSVITAKINDSAVTAGKIANDAVITAKINDNAVTSGKIADNAVITAKINNGAVTEAKIATDAVVNAKIKDGEVSLDKLDTTIISGTGAGRKVQDSLISAIHTSVVGRIGAGSDLANYTIRVLTQAQYDGATKTANTIYFING